MHYHRVFHLETVLVEIFIYCPFFGLTPLILLKEKILVVFVHRAFLLLSILSIWSTIANCTAISTQVSWVKKPPENVGFTNEFVLQDPAERPTMTAVVKDLEDLLSRDPYKAISMQNIVLPTDGMLVTLTIDPCCSPFDSSPSTSCCSPFIDICHL